MPRVSSLSKEYGRMPVWAREDGHDVDLKVGVAVDVAFVEQDPVLPPTQPQSGDWMVGEWEDDPSSDILYARGIMDHLDPGWYRMWVKLSGAPIHPEEPVLTHDVLFEVY